MTSQFTKGQREFLLAVANGQPGSFHKRVIEPVEGLPFGKAGGFVQWTGGMRLVGCNSFSVRNFALTDEGCALFAAVGDRTHAASSETVA